MTVTREYTLDYDKPEEAARTTLQLHIDTLVRLRNTTRKRDELEWEIRVYEYCLKDPVSRLKAYQTARYGEAGDSEPLEKREAIAKLGWVIP